MSLGDEMQTYEIIVRERSVRANSRDTTLVRTSVGVDRVHILFDNAEWLDFPVSITFAHGDRVVTEQLVIAEMSNTDEWVAESWADVPWEVIESVGPIRITLQGTDSSGRHIITAKGSPLSVIESGDVAEGDVPADAPTISQWEQAYADAMVVVNEAASLKSSLREQLVDMVTSAESALDGRIAQSYVPATRERLGLVRIGDGISVTDSGVISSEYRGFDTEQVDRISKLYSLANIAFADPFIDGSLNESTVLSSNIMPIATIDNPGVIFPDGVTVIVDDNGMMSAVIDRDLTPIATTSVAGKVIPDGTTITVDSDGTIHGANTYILPVATTSELGGVKPDGISIVVEEDGTISAPPPNWDQNDQYGAGYIENRPFYRTTSTVLETTTMRAWSASGTMPPYHPKARDVPIGSSLVLGATYLVKMSGRIWNGEYVVTCRDASSIGIDGFTSGLVLHATKDYSGTGGISRNEFVIHQPDKSINSVNVCFKLPDVEGYNYWQYQESSLSIDRYYVTTIPFMYLPIPTDTERGAVRPDGVTVTMDDDGTIHGTAVDDFITQDGSNPVRSSAVYEALQGKADSDSVPTKTSDLVNDSGYVTDTGLATSETYGICRPDNATTFVSDGVISAIDYTSQIDDLLAMIASLRQRVAALEGGSSAVSDVTYEDGSLMTGWTYDNYAMLTDSEYDNGSMA